MHQHPSCDSTSSISVHVQQQSRYVIAGKQADRFTSSDESSDYPPADRHVHVCYPHGPPKQVRKWCQNLTDELGSAMHRLQVSLSPERPRT